MSKRALKGLQGNRKMQERPLQQLDFGETDEALGARAGWSERDRHSKPFPGRSSSAAMERPASLVLALIVSLAGCIDTEPAPEAGGEEGETGEAVIEETQLAVTANLPYTFDPATLSAPAGSLVNLTLTNSDPLMPHNWVLDEASATTDTADSDASVSVMFIAPEAGEYQFYCAVGNHRDLGMVGTFTVT